jgi:hypothetical protein
MKLSAAGSALGYSTYLGGDADENAGGIVVDDEGRAIVVGGTNSSNFPVASAMQPARAPGSCGITPGAFFCFDVFVSRIAAGGGVLDFSTYFGGSGDDRGADVVLDATGNIWLAGFTTSTDVPLENPLQSELAGPSPTDVACIPNGAAPPRCPDALIVAIDEGGGELLFSTYLGGVRRDAARSIAIDTAGRVAIGGGTQSFDFPTVDAWQSNYVLSFGCPLATIPCSDAFVTLLDADATGIAYSTYLGWIDDEGADALAAAPDGSIVMSGTTGPTFPVTPGALRRHATGNEAFVARFAVPPAAGMLATLGGTGEPGAPFPTVTPASRTLFGVVMDVAVRNGTSRYVVDSSSHRVLLIDGANQVTVVAGDGTPGNGGDGGPAVSAQLSSPSGVSVDAAGNLYIADTGNHRIRMVTLAGTILTIAGTGVPGYSGDGGQSFQAQLNSPVGVVVHGDKLLVADTGNFRVRMISSDGTIITIAGNGTFASTGDNGQSVFASLMLPTGLAVDPLGRLLIADFGAHVVRRVEPSGIITTVAGTGVAASTGDDGPATAATLNGPFGIDVSDAGQILIAELLGHRLRSIAPGGTIDTIAGTGSVGPIQVPPRAGTESPLVFPAGVAFDGRGNVLLTDIGNDRVALLHGVAP